MPSCLGAPHPRDGEYAAPGDQHRGPIIRAVLRQILETGDVVGTDTSGRVVITLAVDAWPLNKLTAFDGEAEDLEARRASEP
jgi:hypothetical protein